MNYDQLIGNAGIFAVGITASEGAETVEATIEEEPSGILTEVTSDYDLAVDGARAFASDVRSGEFYVYIPVPDGDVSVRISPSVGIESPGICTDAARELVDTAIETVQLG